MVHGFQQKGGVFERESPWIFNKRGYCYNVLSMIVKGKFSMFSHEKRYTIRAKVHGKGGILLTSRLACAPLLDWTAVAGPEAHQTYCRVPEC